MSAREWAGWVTATLVVALAVHIASVRYLPRAIMHIALSHMGAVNTIHHQRRPDAHTRGVVRPSPDLLYSACPFDLSKGGLLVTAPVPPNTYWSVSVFDADTNNIFALNDRQARTDKVMLQIVRAGRPMAALLGKKNEPRFDDRDVISPTTRGIVLFRTLINNENNFAKIDAVRRRASCAPIVKR
jgi:uncharacterized membrane protein